ncbi:MAG: hypothetical protein HKN92_04260 [Chitinophagales bacterium]|nr:hypothetical protein [Chitinophagales bacterium]
MTSTIPLSTTFFLGALHSLEPGHGKSFLAAYMFGNKSNARHIVTMVGSLLISHFLFLTVIALTLQFAFKGIADETLLHTTSWLAPLIVIAFGLFLFTRYLKFKKHPQDCSCGHEEKHLHLHESHNLKKSAIAGAVGGLIPCPTAIATILFAGMTNHFQNVLFYILVYIVGMLLVYFLLVILFHFSKKYMQGRIDSLSNKIHPKLVSSILIMFIGVVYLTLHLSH